MRSATQRRAENDARAIDDLIAATVKVSFEDLEPRFKELERHLLTKAESKAERLEIRQRIAETLFTSAFSRDCTWPVFGRTLRRIQRLGYSHIERRYHVAALYALWCHKHPEHDSAEARHLLDDVERRIDRLPRGHEAREELTELLTSLRARTGFIRSRS